MLLTLTTERAPATDLSWLLVKHPGRLHTFPTSVGEAQVFFPEATDERCTVVLTAEVDPVGLVRGPKRHLASLGSYVNDRPYASGSFLAVALNRAFRSAMAGTCKDRPELVDQPLPLRIEAPALSVRGGPRFLADVFEPLGYRVHSERVPLDPDRPEWGDSGYLRVVLEVDAPVRDVLNHLYVLLPVLDDAKHYWIGEDEADKLVEKAGDWLGEHPLREAITRRYLKRQRPLIRHALAALLSSEAEEVEEQESAKEVREAAMERGLSLNEQRLKTVIEEVVGLRARSVLDLGCGEGKLVRRLLKVPEIGRVVGADVSLRSLDIAEKRCERLPERLKEQLSWIQASATYRDRRFTGFDVACLIEVVEHIDAERLPSVVEVVFGQAKPGAVILTTPNVEYNALFEGIPPGRLRHDDHRWEWTRAELAAWAGQVATDHGYQLRLGGIGPEDPALGCPTQIAVFTR